jgi:uncharacterized RDD family membrane protein YckC
VRDLHRIRTPENVTFEFELAGMGGRTLAYGIDLVVMGGLTALAMVVSSTFGAWIEGVAAAAYFVAAFIIQWGYGALCEWRFHGQSIGKRIVGLRVVSFYGTPLTFVQAAVRNLVRIVDLLPAAYLVGGVTALVDPHGRRLGDIAASTIVVRQRRSLRPSAVMAEADRYNSFIRDEHVVNAVSRITAPERDVMVGLAMRRETLPLVVRYSLFAKLATHLEHRLAVKRPDYLSEERFVLNLTAVALGMWRGAGRAYGTGNSSVVPR